MRVESQSGIVSAANSDEQASVLVARKALDVQKQQGETIVRLIESANVAKVAGDKGYLLDVVA